MKKVAFLLILAVIGTYGVGRVMLGESGAMRFLTSMESMMSEGKAEEVCAMFHEDLEIEISDDSGESPKNISGGKPELCDITKATVAGLSIVPHSMNVDYTEVNARQDWLHPWTGEISYLENRSFSIPGASITLRTVSHDEITLVHTFSGVKLRKLKSEVYKADAT
ncbi:MAG TPA: hypothetical protein VEW08_11980 [Steroidobacteraceae bacterium]|nr:hypothetical protein [Steroidobacteraceae bacterium]